jgi:hypothetical protein
MKILTKLRSATGKIKLGLAAGAVVLVATIVPFTATSPAKAAFSDCGPDRLCVWDYLDGGGAMTYYGGNWHHTCVNVITSWNDRIGSARNNLTNGQRVWFYNGANCSGYISFPTSPGNNRNFADPFQYNQITSIYFGD